MSEQKPTINRAIERRSSRRGFILKGFAGLTVSGVALGTYAVGIEPHWFELVERTMTVPNLPASLVGKTLVQLSDLHIGRRVDPQYLARAFAFTADLKPDIVVITGDIMHGADGTKAREAAELIRDNLRTDRLATFACLGNHDYGADWKQASAADELSDRLEEAGIRVLRNDSAEVDGLRFVGLEDRWGTNWSATKANRLVRDVSPQIVLLHNPDVCDEPIWGDYAGWILSGHTHGGQCKPPFLPPPKLPVLNRRYTCGEFALSGGRTLYINRALGYLHRVRFLVRPEITRFTLQPA